MMAANRGEIAVRVFSEARLGITTEVLAKPTELRIDIKRTSRIWLVKGRNQSRPT